MLAGDCGDKGELTHMATLVHSKECQTALGMGLADNSRRRHRSSLEVSVVRDV